MRHETIAVANGLLGRILQAAGGDPCPDCFTVFELLGDAGIAPHKFIELVLRGDVVWLRVAARIDGQTNANERVSREWVDIKWDNPEPAALETMVQCAFVVGDG